MGKIYGLTSSFAGAFLNRGGIYDWIFQQIPFLNKATFSNQLMACQLSHRRLYKQLMEAYMDKTNLGGVNNLGGSF